MANLKNLSTTLKYGFYTIAIAVFMAVGFYIGRKTVKIPKPKTVIEYVEAEPIHDTLYKTKPVAVKAPIDTAGIIRACIEDGIYKELWPKEKEFIAITKEDTTAIMVDWATERRYKETIFNSDTLGKCVVEATVKYNRLNLTGYEFTPKVKTIDRTIYTVKKWSPYVKVGSLFGPWNKTPDTIGEFGGGIFYKDKLGLEMTYQRGFISKNDYVGTAILYKF